MFDRLLVPLSGDLATPELQRCALGVASARDLLVEGVYAMDDGSAHDAETAVASLRERCETAGVRCEPLVRSGSTVEVLLERSVHEPLVMLTSEGFEPSRLVLLEPPLQTVLRRSKAPVWIAATGSRPPLHVVLAFHGQRKAYHAAELAANIALAWDLPVDILVVAEDEEVDEHDINLAREELYVRHMHERAARLEKGVTRDEVPLVLARYATPDALLVMGGYGDGQLLGIRLGDTVDRTIRNATGNVLICP